MVDLSAKTGKSVSGDASDPAVQVPGENLTAEGIAERLRIAVKDAGGPAEVSAQSGVPTRTLSWYLSGRDMKVPALLALAAATHVRVEWLTTGRGPRRDTDSASEPAVPLIPGALPHGAFGTLDVDRLAEAIRRAEKLYAEEKRVPSPRRYAQILLLLYDDITDEVAEGDS